MSLTETQRRHLRRLAHGRKPVARTGAAGLTAAVVAEVERGLTDHELIKVKLAGGDRATRHAWVEALATRTGAEVVQRVGQVVVLYRPNPEKRGERIALP